MIEIESSTTYDSDSDSMHGLVLWMSRQWEPQVIWTCEDDHPTKEEAEACAAAEKERRLAAHKSLEEGDFQMSDLEAGYDHKTPPGGVPYFEGRLALLLPGEPPDIQWICVHRHASAPAALRCAEYERDRRVRAADHNDGGKFMRLLDAGQLTQVFREIQDWAGAHDMADPASAHYRAAVGLCMEVIRRWPDRDWRAYLS